MKFFIILTILVSGLSVWGSRVMSVNAEITEVTKALVFTPPPANRGIASATPAPSCPEGDSNCTLLQVNNTESGTLAGGSRVGGNPLLNTAEITTNGSVSAKPPATQSPRGNGGGADDGISVKKGN